MGPVGEIRKRAGVRKLGSLVCDDWIGFSSMGGGMDREPPSRR